MIMVDKEVLNLYNKDANSAYASLKELVKISDTSNEVYIHMEEFIHMMHHKNSYVRTRGIILCSANAKWDNKQLLDNHIMEFLSHFEDEKPITSRQCIQQVHHIARYKPNLCQTILHALQTTSVTYADSMQSLIYKDRQKAIRQVTQWMGDHENEDNSMANPWNTIALQDYEQHMSLDSIGQLQALRDIMRKQFLAYDDVKDMIILGIAGGNGLQHIVPNKYDHVYGLDINEQYVKQCVERFWQLKDVFIPLCVDLREQNIELPSVDYVIANLLIEYIGYESFCHAIKKMNPEYISCVIQINDKDDFVSDSPYVHAFDDLASVHHDICETQLNKRLKTLHYEPIFRDMLNLKNGKALLRMDFRKEK